MSTDVGTAVVQHALDVGRLYLQNAVLTRGIPDKPERLHVHLPEELAAVAPLPPPVQGNPPTQPQSRPASNIAQWGALAVALASGVCVAGIPWLVSIANQRPAPAPVQQVKPGDSSLLQYLEDTGYHLPAEKRPK